MKKFEKAFDMLNKATQKLESSDIKLSDAIKAYEEGMKYYEECNAVLDEAKQKVLIYNKDSKTLEPFDYVQESEEFNRG